MAWGQPAVPTPAAGPGESWAGICLAGAMRDGGSAAHETVLRLEGVAAANGDVAVVSGVSFAVAAGAAVALVGPNGGGKSTLLRCATGRQQVTAGAVRLLGRPVEESRPWARRAVAALLEDVGSFPRLSVLDHLLLVAAGHGVESSTGGMSGAGRHDVEERVLDLLEELQLLDVADAAPWRLSSGQRRRLLLAATLVRPRRLLVLDEPESRLDPRTREWLADRLRAETEAGGAVLLASHDARLVQHVAAQVLLVDAGTARALPTGTDVEELLRSEGTA